MISPSGSEIPNKTLRVLLVDEFFDWHDHVNVCIDFVSCLAKQFQYVHVFDV